MKESCLGDYYNIRSKGSPKINDSPSALKISNKSSTSKQTSIDKSPKKEKEKEKENEKENKLFLENPPSIWI